MIVPFAQLTDDLIRAADVVSAVDPSDPNFGVEVYRASPTSAWAPVATPPTARVLVVGLDTAQRDAQFDELRRRVTAIKSGSP